jgi:hypothetical protein
VLKDFLHKFNREFIGKSDLENYTSMLRDLFFDADNLVAFKNPAGLRMTT